MTHGFMKLMAAIVGVALALRLVYELLAPILPALMVAAIVASVVYLASILRRRDRW